MRKLIAAAALVAASCAHETPAGAGYPTTGSIERLSPRLDELIAADAKIEVLAERFEWSEGPVWIKQQKCLIFSDIPNNVVNRWRPGQGLTTYLKPSGYTSGPTRGGEIGSNALTLDPMGRLVLCQHGDRRVARMAATLADPKPKYETLADRYEGKRLNSPNDLVYHSSGALYFTDPPYGLERQDKDPAREMDYCGVFRLSPGGELTLLTNELSRPNGIAFSPDEKIIYFSNSDPERAIWAAYDVKSDGTIANYRVFFDSTSMVGPKNPGLPDGMKLDVQGNLFATGPGGVFVFTPDGKHLGTIRTGQKTANCAWGDDGRTLYLCAHMYLMRIRTKTRGVIPGPG